MGRLHSTPLVISTILTGSFLPWATESIPTVFSFQGSQYGAVADMWLIMEPLWLRTKVLHRSKARYDQFLYHFMWHLPGSRKFPANIKNS